MITHLTGSVSEAQYPVLCKQWASSTTMHWQPRIIPGTRSIQVIEPKVSANVVCTHIEVFLAVNYHPKVRDNHICTMIWIKKELFQFHHSMSLSSHVQDVPTPVTWESLATFGLPYCLQSLLHTGVWRDHPRRVKNIQTILTAVKVKAPST